MLWEMTQDAAIVSSRYTRSVIKSRAALTYAEAQTRIDDERLNDELTQSLRTLMRLGKVRAGGKQGDRGEGEEGGRESCTEVH